ncbi:MAG: helix-turn-helix domain-containing protein [Actinomycetes bacterium]
MPDIPKGRRIVGEARASLTTDLAKRYEKGASIRELAEMTGRSYGFVHRLLKDSGATLRSRGGATRGRRTAT